MNILFLSQLVPYPPDAGPKVRSYYTLRYLAQMHDVTLLAFSRPDDTPEALEHLRSFCRAVHAVPLVRSRGRDLQAMLASLLTGKPFVIRRDWIPRMAEKVDFEFRSSNFDFIHSDQLWMAQYLDALGFERLRGSHVQSVLDAHNASFQIFERLAQGDRNPLKRLVLERESRALRGYEARICRAIDHLVTVSEHDQRTLEKLNDGTGELGDLHRTSRVIPICTDLQALQPVEPQPGSLEVLHLGTMFWLPNVEGVEWFIREVWSLVRRAVPGANFTIAGKRPAESLLRLAEADPSIHTTGYVADPRPYLERCAAFIVPLHSGSGMRVKIVESWARGLPIVSTTVGVEGLQIQDGENILIADSPQAFAEAVCRLLSDGALNRRLRANGRIWAEERYDWQNIYPLWDAIYQVAPEMR